MGIFDGLPNFGGTAEAYGIATAPMQISAGLLPGGGSLGAGAAPMWITPGSGQRPAGLGAMACAVPGMGDGSNANTNTNSANASSSSVSSSNATGGNASNTITIQPGSSGVLSGESAPFALALGGLAVFGAIFYFAMKGR